MPSLGGVVKPKSKRGKRYLENRAPKVVENTKQAMFLKGGRVNEITSKSLKQLYTIKRPFSVMLAKKNILRPFDDSKPLEYLASKNDCSLFMFGSSSKKRPNTLVVGRTFDNEVTDMFEWGIDNVKFMEEFKEAKIILGAKPVLIFHGEPFELDSEYQRLKCLLTDFFRGESVENLRLEGVEHVISFTAIDGKILFRSYKAKLENSGSKVPSLSLTEIGPSFDFSVRRAKISSDVVYRKAKKQPKEIQPKKKKNISKDAFGSVLGRIHMQKQDLGKLQLRKLKAFKSKRTEDASKEKKEKPVNQNNNRKKQKIISE